MSLYLAILTFSSRLQVYISQILSLFSELSDRNLQLRVKSRDLYLAIMTLQHTNAPLYHAILTL